MFQSESWRNTAKPQKRLKAIVDYYQNVLNLDLFLFVETRPDSRMYFVYLVTGREAHEQFRVAARRNSRGADDVSNLCHFTLSNYLLVAVFNTLANLAF